MSALLQSTQAASTREVALADKRFEICLAVGSCSLCSIGMTVFNKLAIEAFPLPFMLVLFQMAVTVLCMLVFCWGSLHIGSWYDMLRWSAVAPLFAGVLLTSMFALKSAPMSLVIVFRGLAPMFGLAVESFYPTPLKVTPVTMASLIVLLMGVALYSKELSWSSNHLAAIGWVLLNNAFVVCNRLVQRLMLAKDQWPVDISGPSLTLLSDLFAMAPLLVAAWIHGEYPALPAAISRLDARGMLWVALSCLVAVATSYINIWTQSLINATSFLVLATVNKFSVILIEVFVMKSKALTALQIFGAILTILAGVAYAKAREASDEEEKLLDKTNNDVTDAPEVRPLLAKEHQV
mmetsp:Transcript_7633/g.18912  ORF Transcript_7633/g.18912 Transcript_7633/m.18912 type:complete len:350 (-) Transcript_7633:52-1101(-)